MTKKKKKEAPVVLLHQHIDEMGIVFGALHPIDANHKNENTQKFHDLSIISE